MNVWRHVCIALLFLAGGAAMARPADKPAEDPAELRKKLLEELPQRLQERKLSANRIERFAAIYEEMAASYKVTEADVEKATSDKDKKNLRNKQLVATYYDGLAANLKSLAATWIEIKRAYDTGQADAYRAAAQKYGDLAKDFAAQVAEKPKLHR